MADNLDFNKIYGRRGYQAIRDLPVFRNVVFKTVDRLLELEAKTHPINGLAPGKEHDSVKALKCAEQLLEWLVGWAVDHQAGLVLTDTEGFPWPEGDEKAQRQTDDHRHEAAGSAYLRKIECTDHAGDAVTNRRIIAAVTDWAPILPSELNRQLCDSLKALDMEDTQDLLQRTKQRPRSSYALWKSRFLAVLHVHFLWGRQEKKKNAFVRVAAAYGCSKETVTGWEKSLPERFTPGSVRYYKQHVFRAGETVYRLQQTIPESKDDKEIIAHYLRVYGEPGISQSGREYRRILKEIAERGN